MSNSNRSNSNSNSNNNFMVTLNFGDGNEATVTSDEYHRIRVISLSNTHGFATSHQADKTGIEKALMKVIDSMDRPRVPRLHRRLVHLTLRLALKLGIFSPPMLTPVANQLAYPTQRYFNFSHRVDDAESRRQARRFKQFLLDIGKFYRGDIREGVRTRQNAYDISGEPFTSLDDGTFYGVHGTNRYQPADPRVAKVKRVLRRHLGRVPTDKDIDTFVYMYFGSDEFGGVPVLKYGIQNSHYTASGRHTRRDEYNSDGIPNPIRRPMQRSQRRVRRLRGPHRQRRYEYGSNSENRSNYNSSNANSTNSNNSNTSASRSAQYARNKSRVNANKAKNKSYKNSIKWEEHTVNNLPSDPVTLNTFSNGQKAVKIHPTANHYVSPQTFRSMARTSMTDAFNKRGNAVLFENPMTRQNVRRSNIKFVVLKNKNTGRATKAKKNAANKIGDARRRQLTRRSTLARAKAVMAALKRKRSQ